MTTKELKETTQEFASDTSLHGFPHIVQAKTKLIVGFWTVIFLAALGMFLFMISTLIMTYYSYPIVIVINEVRLILYWYKMF